MAGIGAGNDSVRLGIATSTKQGVTKWEFGSDATIQSQNDSRTHQKEGSDKAGRDEMEIPMCIRDCLRK